MCVIYEVCAHMWHTQLYGLRARVAPGARGCTVIWCWAMQQCSHTVRAAPRCYQRAIGLLTFSPVVLTSRAMPNDRCSQVLRREQLPRLKVRRQGQHRCTQRAPCAPACITAPPGPLQYGP